MSDNMEAPLSREEHLLNYVKSLDEVEKAIQPYKEHKRALKEHYLENDFLSKEELSLALRAYRMLKSEVDVDSLMEVFEQVKKVR
jgi:hypothetical protein